MEFKDKKPIYLQIADHICNQILLDELHEEEKLPSVRDYAADMEVNVNTVARTFEWLQNHEIVTSRRGLGKFVCLGAKPVIEAVRREEFYNQQIPELRRTMTALNISVEDLVNHLQETI